MANDTLNEKQSEKIFESLPTSEPTSDNLCHLAVADGEKLLKHREIGYYISYDGKVYDGGDKWIFNPKTIVNGGKPLPFKQFYEFNGEKMCEEGRNINRMKHGKYKRYSTITNNIKEVGRYNEGLIVESQRVFGSQNNHCTIL